MTRKSKIIFIVGSVVIGIAAALIILFGLMLGGVINVRGNTLVISSASREFVYNGEEQSDSSWQLISGKLSKGDRIVAEVTGSREEVGSSLNYITATVLNSDGADVTENYEIEYKIGTLTVLARPITLTTAGDEKTYDGEELSNGDWQITKGNLVKGQEITVTMSAAITDAGEVENAAQVSIFSGETEVTDNYAITYNTGVLKVNPIELHFITPTLSKTYDGEPLFSEPDDFEWVSGKLLTGHKVTVMKVVGRITNVGEIENAVEIKIAAANGTDITKNYKAVLDSGTLTVRGFGITISTSSSEKVYDGTPLVNGEWTLYKDTPLVEGHEIKQVIMPASQTNAGTAQNEITQIVIVDEKGENVTENYEINYSIGTLVVLPRQLTIQSGSAIKEYDGKPLTCNEWKFTSFYKPVSGHTAEVNISGTITNPGQRDNTVAQVIISDKAGKDLTANYEITLDEGILIVTGKIDGNTSGEGSGSGSGGEVNLDESGNIGNLGGSGGNGGSGDGSGGGGIALNVKTQYGGMVYLRLKSFGDCDGVKWSEAKEYPKAYQGYGFNYLTGFALQSAGYKSETISLAVNGSGYFLPYYMAAGDFDYDKQTSDVYNKGSSRFYSLEYYSYDYISVPLDTTLSGIEINDYNAFVHSNYCVVTNSTKAYLQSIIESQGWKKTDSDIIEKVAAYVRNVADYNLEYDGDLDDQSDIVLAFLRDYKSGVCRHYASAATLLYRQLGIPARYTIGYVTDTEAGEWKKVSALNAHAWVEVYIDNVGWVQVEVTGGGSAGGVFEGGGGPSGEQGGEQGGEVSGNTVKIKPVTEYYKYDGRTTFTHSGALQGLSFFTQLGYTYEAEISGSFKSPGKYTVNIKSFTLYNSSGRDVTEDFKFNLQPGALQVYQYEITVTTGGASKTYDGAPLTSDICNITGGHLAQGHSLEYFRTTASRTDVGVSINSYEIKIVDSSGADVGYKYKINSDYGLLAVSAREITVTAGSAERVYNGTALTCDKYDIEGSLAPGHSAKVVISGSNKGKAGTAENKVQSVTISDANGKDVTLNYKITTVNGLLTVYPD